MAHHHHHHRHHAGGGTNPLIYVLIVVLLVGLGGMFYYSHVQDQKEQAHLVELERQEREERRAREEAERQAELARQEEERRIAEERAQLRAQDSFYQLLADGFDVNVLIVGDSIGAGSGASDADHRWANLLKTNIESKYGVAVTLTNVSMGGNASYAGYVRTMALNDGVSYDLVVLCYGQNDSKTNFSLYYESIIRAVKLKYPKASIICIQESSQKDYTEKMQTIQAIADHYGLPVADTIAPFQANYDNLVKDSVHPNDDGQQVYYETVMNVIEPLVTARQGYDPENVAVVNDRVTVFDTFQWFPVDQFTREGNTFTLKTQTHGAILGIDYNFTSGANSCKILVDGVEYAAPEVTFNYDFSQRHIMIVNKWLEGETVNVQSEIKVVFAEDEAGKNQADGFKGLTISGQ